ncbi:MAG TPA: HPr family phosphocarrier protein [Candidatus Paenibacillus intestinavium]|nr:HPr family phosphocarrier protein [Candidatus Paenibacillus intestinavium]
MQKTYEVKNMSGIHARPAQKIAEAAQRYTDDVHFIKAGQLYNAKSLLTILSMGAKYKEKISVVATGQGAEEIIEEIGRLLCELKKS